MEVRWELGYVTTTTRVCQRQVTEILAGAIFDRSRILIASRWDQVGRLTLCDYWKISVQRTPLAEDLRSSQGRIEGTRRPQPTARRLMAVVWAHEAHHESHGHRLPPHRSTSTTSPHNFTFPSQTLKLVMTREDLLPFLHLRRDCYHGQQQRVKRSKDKERPGTPCGWFAAVGMAL